MFDRLRPSTVASSLAVLLLALGLAACGEASSSPSGTEAVEPPADTTLERATFAGGCFWCMEPPFEDLPGVQSVLSGYAGGTKANPTYDDVSSGRTDYVEAVQITYDSDEISYERLLDVFWRSIDPTDAGGQFADRGSQYETAIFYHDERQQQLAEGSKQQLAETGPFDEEVVTPIRPYTNFYRAEEYHQDFYRKNPERYESYAEGSGRKPFLRRVWGKAKDMSGAGDYRSFQKPTDDVLRERLSFMQYRVTQRDGTEPPFLNAYWNEKGAGIYVDVVSGEPLFSSKDKYKSGTGWPSFTKPLEPDLVLWQRDGDPGWRGIEVRSKYGDSHLGHVFDDGPEPTGLRYCMNSAALRFIPANQLEAEGYGQYAGLFR